jgi:hypothetical protein
LSIEDDRQRTVPAVRQPLWRPTASTYRASPQRVGQAAAGGFRDGRKAAALCRLPRDEPRRPIVLPSERVIEVVAPADRRDVVIAGRLGQRAEIIDAERAAA